jgi:hypothetical protein
MLMKIIIETITAAVESATSGDTESTVRATMAAITTEILRRVSANTCYIVSTNNNGHETENVSVKNETTVSSSRLDAQAQAETYRVGRAHIKIHALIFILFLRHDIL